MARRGGCESSVGVEGCCWCGVWVWSFWGGVLLVVVEEEGGGECEVCWDLGWELSSDCASGVEVEVVR